MPSPSRYDFQSCSHDAMILYKTEVENPYWPSGGAASLVPDCNRKYDTVQILKDNKANKIH